MNRQGKPLHLGGHLLKMVGFDENTTQTIKQLLTVPDECETLYQYTTIDALFNGILVRHPMAKKEGYDICLWGSNCAYMNDPRELHPGRQIVDSILSIKPGELGPKDDFAFETLLEGVFLTSLSMTVDSLPMWSMYGKNGAGIALGFNKERLNEVARGRLLKCVYHTTEIEDSFIQLFFDISLAKLKSMSYEEKVELYKRRLPYIVSNMDLLINILMASKSSEYSYEQEVRIYNNLGKIKYRLANNLIIPYVENYFPKDVLTEIWVGPTNDMSRSVKSLRRFIDHLGFEHVKIKESSIPYRA